MFLSEGRLTGRTVQWSRLYCMVWSQDLLFLPFLLFIWIMWAWMLMHLFISMLMTPLSTVAVTAITFCYSVVQATVVCIWNIQTQLSYLRLIFNDGKTRFILFANIKKVPAILPRIVSAQTTLSPCLFINTLASLWMTAFHSAWPVSQETEVKAGIFTSDMEPTFRFRQKSILQHYFVAAPGLWWCWCEHLCSFSTFAGLTLHMQLTEPWHS